ncbi:MULTISPECIES: hypothetical protein [Nitratireductor]|uniref:Uncharacterized protein n=1 Tax=Nitratireductor thuwali TaxID=2267699 RepID=A0ABY5MI66_9HYPH|nr:hypothetical protein [Nitratireductor luteus]UUP16944.1 hypothetical protein NTH_01394 [Nitratireductor thuwali]
MSSDKNVEAQIEALLANDDSISVIESLLALPRVADSDPLADEWERAMHARLQARLSRKMRGMIGKRSASNQSAA